MSEQLAATGIGTYLNDLAGDQPAPGGGSAAAICGALAAALISMVCRLTLKDTAYIAAHGEVGNLLARSEALRPRLLALAADDARVAGGMVRLVHALAAAANDDRDDLAAQVQDALKAAAGTSHAILDACAAAVEMSEVAVRLGSKAALSDVGAAAAAAAAGAEGAALTVAINLAVIEDADFVRRMRCTTGALAAEAEGRHAQIVAEVRRQL